MAAVPEGIRDLLPVEDRLARTLADNAIELFLEYRDVHGYEEEMAAVAAVRDVVEGATAVLIDPGPRARGGGTGPAVSAPTRRRGWVLWLCLSAVLVGFCVAIWSLPLWRFGVAFLLMSVLLIIAGLWASEGKR